MSKKNRREFLKNTADTRTGAAMTATRHAPSGIRTRGGGGQVSAPPPSDQRTADKRARAADNARTEGQRLLLLVPGSLTDLTARLEAGRSTVSDWRRGAKLPEPDARARLHAAYGIPVRAWDRQPQPPPAPAAPVSRYTDLDPEDAEIQRGLDELTRDIPDEMVMHHPLYRDMHSAVLAVLRRWAATHEATLCLDGFTRGAAGFSLVSAVRNAVAEVEDEIGPDGWRPERRPTPTPETQP